MPANPNARKPKQTAKPANRRKAHDPPALVPATHDLSADVTLLNSVTTHRQNGRFAPGNPFAFRPGQSGNPAGRPKGVRYLSETYRDRLAQVSTSDPEGRTHAQILGDMVVTAALSGNLKAITEVTDRTEGRPKTVFVSLDPPNPLQSEEWIRLRIAMADALEPFPEAREALLRVLAEHSEDSDDD